MSYLAASVLTLSGPEHVGLIREAATINAFNIWRIVWLPLLVEGINFYTQLSPDCIILRKPGFFFFWSQDFPSMLRLFGELPGSRPAWLSQDRTEGITSSPGLWKVWGMSRISEGDVRRRWSGPPRSLLCLLENKENEEKKFFFYYLKKKKNSALPGKNRRWNKLQKQQFLKNTNKQNCNCHPVNKRLCTVCLQRKIFNLLFLRGEGSGGVEW